MAKHAPSEQSVDAKKVKSFVKGKKTAVCVGAVLSLGVVFLGGWLFRTWMEPANVSQPPERTLVGVIDLSSALKSHKDYRKLEQLRQECEALRAELETAILPVPQVDPPRVEEKPFEDSVWQKNAQNVIGRATELSRQQKKNAMEYRSRTEGDFLARKARIDEAYLNDITNIRLKLDNADVLGLSEEVVLSLAAQLEQLQKERGEKQHILREQWEDEIKKYARQSVAESMEELKAQAVATKEQLEAEAMKRQSDAQARDVQAMETQMQAAQRFRKAAERQRALEEKEQEVLSLENHMYNDVAGKTAKLAILHHFTLVVANPATRTEYLIPWENRVGTPPERFAKVIASGAEDITQELMEELEYMK